MKIISNPLLVIPALIALAYSSLVQPSKSTNYSLARSNELWELAIAAKGGRGALYKIHAIAEIHDDQGKNVTFIALPDRYFSWFDARPGQFGLDVKLYNYQTGFGYRVLGNQGVRTYSDIRTHPDFKYVRGRSTDILYIQLFFLLETRWMQPKPLIALKDRVGGKSVDRVDVLIEGYGSPQRFAIYLDEKTYLPVRIAMCRDVNTTEISDFCCFANHRNYVEMEGIKIPTEISGKNTPWGKNHIELNPDYDPQFFDHPPDHDAGGLQWRKIGAKPLANNEASPAELTSDQVAQFIQNLDSPEEEIRESAVRELLSAGKQVSMELKKALAEAVNNPLRRYGLAVILVKLNEQDNSISEALADLVADSQLNAKVRQDAAFGLLGNDQRIGLLMELLEHSDIQVRRYVLHAFDELTERAKVPAIVEKAIPVLKKLKKDKDSTIRGLAKEVLEQIEARIKK